MNMEKILLKHLNRSQSLFYWNPFCNSKKECIKTLKEAYRNPYFIGILSAMKKSLKELADENPSQSLFYWNPFCNLEEEGVVLLRNTNRNPYFIGILSAIKKL